MGEAAQCVHLEGDPCALQLERALTQQRAPSTTKNTYKSKTLRAKKKRLRCMGEKNDQVGRLKCIQKALQGQGWGTFESLDRPFPWLRELGGASDR